MEISSIETNPVFTKFREAAKTNNELVGFQVIVEGEGISYDRAREISNSYFNRKPLAVAFPRTTKQLVACFNFAKENNFEVRLRSGGHQHEGMSSGDGVFMLRLSEMNGIELQDDNTKAWIGTGAKLGDVYNELAVHDKIIPGGGCQNVNIGGLTQGGGWGMNARLWGLTCDNILEVEILLASGELIIASAEKHSDLFWAIKGGGGGNFGIVTRFLFKLQERSDQVWSFRFGWKYAYMEDVMKHWLQNQTGFPKELTSFIRITAGVSEASIDNSVPASYPVYASGLFHGTRDALIKMLEKTFPMELRAKAAINILKDKRWVKKGSKHTEENAHKDRLNRKGIEPISLKMEKGEVKKINIQHTSITQLQSYDEHGSTGSLDDTFNADACIVSPPRINCGAVHPHKVSSAFSNGTGFGYYKVIAHQIGTYIRTHPVEPKHVRSYITFHSMSGAIQANANGEDYKRAFAFGDREFLLQFQSWWNYDEVDPFKEDKKSCRSHEKWQESYINWVKNFRKTLAKEFTYTDNSTKGDITKAGIQGAFINFVDKNLIEGYEPTTGDNSAQKHALLKQYYGDNLDKLIEVKKQYDPDNFFKFEMSIPRK